MTSGDAMRIRALNDAFRRAPELIGAQIAHNRLFVTRGVAARGAAFVDRAVRAVREFDAFSEANDPYGEHDFGTFQIDGETLFWKIDYYDTELNYGSPNPADSRVTRGVLRILLAEEY